MPDFKYIIIGGGMTAEAGIRGIRQVDGSGSIALFSSESHAPYNRPPLSKGLWKGEELESIWRNPPTTDLDMMLSTTIASIDPKQKTVVDTNGGTFSFEKLLIATGGKVRKLPIDAEGLIYFRTLDDFTALKSATETGNTFAVLGGGFIGSEIAAALSINRKSVVMLFPDESIGTRIFPTDLSLYISAYYDLKGIDILAGETVDAIEKRGSAYYLKTSAGNELIVDGVVAGIGIEPSVDLARAAGITVGNGIMVDEYLRTIFPDIYAAGDAASFFSPALEKRVRFEHEDNANTMGELAGKNMAGEQNQYHHLPYFYSDLFDLGYEAVGELDTRYEMVADWKEEFREGVIYYLKDSRVRGVLLWNTWGQIAAARNIISEKGPLNARNVIGRLPQ